MGTREAARALLKAADAAAAPNPTSSNPPQAARPPVHAAAQRTAQTIHQVRTTTAGVKRGSKRFGEAIWGPFARLSGTVLLEITGVLFSLFALTAALEVWKHHADIHATGAARQHLLFAIAMLIVFGYFTLSSFIRASRR